MKKILLYIVLISFLACEEKEQIPEGIWDKDEFSEVLVQFQLAEAVVRLGYHRKVDSTFANDSIYLAAFRDAGVSKEQFEANMEYYLERPKQMSKIYDLTLQKLSEESARIKVKKEEEFVTAD